MSMKFSFLTRRFKASRTPSLVIGPLYCKAGASDGGGLGGGNGCSKGAPCDGCMDAEEGSGGALGALLAADIRGGGTKNDGLIRVARTAGAPSDVSWGSDVANEVIGRAVVVGEIIDGMGIGARGGGAVIAGRDCARGGRAAEVGIVSGLLMRAEF